MKSIIIDDEAKARSALRLSLQNFCPSFRYTYQWWNWISIIG